MRTVAISPAASMNSRHFAPKEKREFNAFWLALKARGLCSVDSALALAHGQFSTRWEAGAGFVVNWREFL